MQRRQRIKPPKDNTLFEHFYSSSSEESSSSSSEPEQDVQRKDEKHIEYSAEQDILDMQARQANFRSFSRDKLENLERAERDKDMRFYTTDPELHRGGAIVGFGSDDMHTGPLPPHQQQSDLMDMTWTEAWDHLKRVFARMLET